MPHEDRLSMEEFEAMARRAGVNIPPEGMEEVKATYEHFAGLLARLWEFPLADEDMAVSFSPAWPPATSAEEGASHG